MDKNNNPFTRIENLLKQLNNYPSEDAITALKINTKREVIEALKVGFKKKAKRLSLFEDIYDEITPNLKTQHKDLANHMNNHKEIYNLYNYESI